MSQSPNDYTHSVGDAYRQGWEALFELLQTGGSFSGRERNCCYLNRGSFPYADVSSVAGFDFPDDGRALGVTDWDGDGAVDVVSANRTAPRLRILRNTSADGGRSLQLVLRGTTVNRDAIGARIELYAQGGDRPLQVDTVRAGEGYLAQSSKLVHFGLGDQPADRVVVRWPGGPAEEFNGLGPGRRYLLVEGSGRAEPLARRPAVALRSEPLAPEPWTDAARIWLAGRVPMPGLQYERFDGGRAPLLEPGRPVLVNLWASWCVPCSRELKEWSTEAERLREAGIDVLALSVDKPEEREKARAWLEGSAEWPFGSGVAGDALVTDLNLVLRGLLDNKGPMPVPTSFLIDGRGRLAAVYKGATELKTLLSDAALLSVDDEEVFLAAQPFPGFWVERPTAGPLSELSITNELINAGRAELGSAYLNGLVTRFQIEELPEDSDARIKLAGSQLNLGVRLADAGQESEAVAALEQALVLRPGYSKAHFNLGVALEGSGRLAEAAVHYRDAAVAAPDHAEASFNLGYVLSELGDAAGARAAYEAAIEAAPGLFDARYNLGGLLLKEGRAAEAVEHLEAAARLRPESAEAAYNLGNAYLVSGDAGRAVEAYRSAVAVDSERPVWRYNLGLALAKNGDAGAACEQFREAVRLDPEYLAALNGLARTLASLPEPTAAQAAEALAAAELAVRQTGGANLGVVDTLAMCQAAAGDFESASATMEAAVKAAEGRAPEATVEQLRSRLEAYRAGRRPL
ncbi:MAG: tetratricopeptide repeat protein [Planctomycetota bacterium]